MSSELAWSQEGLKKLDESNANIVFDPQVPITITTKEIYINPYIDVFSSDADRTALFSYKSKTYYSIKYTFIEEKLKTTDKNGKKYSHRLATPDDIDNHRFARYHRSENVRFYGYKYNVLDCLLQFINDLPINSKIIAERGGEKTMDELFDAMDVSKPEWLYNKPDPAKQYTDKTKVMLLKQIEDACKAKNITLDIRPYYFILKRVVLLKKEKYYTTWVNDDGEDRLHEHIGRTYHIEYPNGKTEIRYCEPYIELDYCKKYGLPVCEIEDKTKSSL